MNSPRSRARNSFSEMQPSRRYLLGYQSEPGAKVTPLRERCAIADRGDHCTGDDWSKASLRKLAIANLFEMIEVDPATGAFHMGLRKVFSYSVALRKRRRGKARPNASRLQ